MPEIVKLKTQGRLQEDKKTEAKTVSTLGVEGEIPCIVVYSDKTHVKYINNILNPLRELLPNRGFKAVFLSDEMKPLEHYGKKFEQLTEECALGIVILDGLRPNVLLELGILLGKNKPIITLQDEKAVVAIKSYYQNTPIKAGLTLTQFNKLREPSLGFFSHISDLQGLHVETVNKDASLTTSKYPKNVIISAIDKLMSRIIREYNKVALKPPPHIKPDHLHKFQSMAFKILEYYAGIKPFKVNDIENAITEVKELEKSTGVNLPSQVYATFASLYVRLAEKIDWRDFHKIMNYYDQAIGIYKRILEFEVDRTLASQAQKKIGDIHWEVSQYRDKSENCKLAIKAYEEALKVRTLDRFPMDYAMT
ncbi:MAG: hypothetical protein IIB45_07635, partial [Candidatus Marinimicrobia bacterium]|nr:hypothetical protein [Candidatus Neomarinimicrobiota bacterium]